jgi:hypothetical protein
MVKCQSRLRYQEAYMYCTGLYWVVLGCLSAVNSLRICVLFVTVLKLD